MSSTIDLSKFCDSETSRYSLQEPFTLRGAIYATDGRIAVRVFAPGDADTAAPDKRFPKMEEIFPPVDGDWEPWPKIDVCNFCEGTNKSICSKCGGDGMCNRCSCGSEHECGHCDGTGDVCCEKCTTPGSLDHRFGKSELALKYAFLISHLPCVEYLPTDKPDVVVRFRFEGGEGAVMPLAKERIAT